MARKKYFSIQKFNRQERELGTFSVMKHPTVPQYVNLTHFCDVLQLLSSGRPFAMAGLASYYWANTCSSPAPSGLH